FRFVLSPVMAPELAAKYPEIQTYAGQGIDDPAATVRFDLTPKGFHAMILSPSGTVFIDPYSTASTDAYISYYKKDFDARSKQRAASDGCQTDTDTPMSRRIAELVAQRTRSAGRVSRPEVANGTTLRTYRLALAATGEYTAYQGGTVSGALAAMTTSINRVNGVYERELSIRMVLVAETDTLIFTNSSTDPYTNNNGSTMLGQNQTTVDARIGSANYDFGHVFSTGGGGVAYLGCICQASVKAGGVTGSPAPVGDPFDIDYVAHEIGHQFGANHPFNGTGDNCSGGNRNASTAYEPGSGTTIMAYAGICGADDLQPNSDDYFHTVSFDEIVAYTTSDFGDVCPVKTATGNTPPTADAGLSYVIPIGTPFVLAGSGTDADGDPLTYCWEQFDLGPAGAPNAPVGDAPIFRSFLPSSNPSRSFPRLQDLQNNTQTLGELLPSYARTMHFRLITRDNRAGGGGVNYATTIVDAAAGTSAFAITSPTTSTTTWNAGSTRSVTWSVGNSNAAPVSCASVDILLSTDGGNTFPITLATGTPNDGSEAVSVPNNITTTARVKIQAVGNIFFDISNQNFKIAVPPTTLADMATTAITLPATVTLGDTVSLIVGTKNAAANAVSSYNVGWSLGGITQQTQTLIRPLQSNEEDTVQFRWIATSGGSQTVKAWTSIAADEVSANDTTTVTKTVVVPAPPQFVWSTGFESATFPPDNWSVVNQDSGQTWTRYTTAPIFGAATVSVRYESSSQNNDDWLIAPRTAVTAKTNLSFYARRRPAGGVFWDDTVRVKISTTNNQTASFTTLLAKVLAPQDPAIARYQYNLAAFSGQNIYIAFHYNELDQGRVQVDSIAVDTLGALSSVSDLPSVQPRAFALQQNYPNPFNPSTSIVYELPSASDVVLRIYDMLGRVVATLTNERQAAGRYTAAFNAQRLSSGIYFYRLTARSAQNNFTDTKKMLLLK
ncbi:MAG: choice-of-anchor J domain-containing protein, partial [Rhizobacter sp.]|nr:choice-of-anchor J domain-containing protein [Chlorobiales bacterium]